MNLFLVAFGKMSPLVFERFIGGNHFCRSGRKAVLCFQFGQFNAGKVAGIDDKAFHSFGEKCQKAA